MQEIIGDERELVFEEYDLELRDILVSPMLSNLLIVENFSLQNVNRDEEILTINMFRGIRKIILESKFNELPKAIRLTSRKSTRIKTD